jgi:hypothetical protein
MASGESRWGRPVDPDSFIVADFCAIDDGLTAEIGARRLRARGPAPVLADSEVLTIEVVGELLGLEHDAAIHRSFRRHRTHFFPPLGRVDRTTFVRQAANLWAVKERLWRRALAAVPHDDRLAVVDSFPIPARRFARAYRCRRFRGEAAFGKDLFARQTFYGFRLHVRLCWPGALARCCLAPANVSETATLPHLLEGTGGVAVGARTAEEAARAGWSCSPPPARPGATRPRSAAACSAASATASTPSSVSSPNAPPSSASGRRTPGTCAAACSASSSATPSPSCSTPPPATRPCNSPGWSPKPETRTRR